MSDGPMTTDPADPRNQAKAQKRYASQRQIINAALGPDLLALVEKYPGIFGNAYVEGIENCASVGTVSPSFPVDMAQGLDSPSPEEIVLTLLRTHRRLHEMLFTWLRTYEAAPEADKDPDNLVAMRVMRGDLKVLEVLCIEVASSMIEQSMASDGETMQ